MKVGQHRMICARRLQTMCGVSGGGQAGRSAQVAWIQEVLRRARVVQGISFEKGFGEP